jgi:hypothetical protein
VPEGGKLLYRGIRISISQIYCSSAGLRGPAVEMLVLLAIGDRVAFVNRFSVAVIGASVVLSHVRRHRACLFG